MKRIVLLFASAMLLASCGINKMSKPLDKQGVDTVGSGTKEKPSPNNQADSWDKEQSKKQSNLLKVDSAGIKQYEPIDSLELQRNKIVSLLDEQGIAYLQGENRELILGFHADLNRGAFYRKKLGLAKKFATLSLKYDAIKKNEELVKHKQNEIKNFNSQNKNLSLEGLAIWRNNFSKKERLIELDQVFPNNKKLVTSIKNMLEHMKKYEKPKR